MNRTSKQTLLWLLIFISIKPIAWAQADKADYRKMAAEVRKDVWAWKIPAFDNRKAPDAYNQYSTVVMARHIEIQAAAKSKFKFMVISAAVTKETSFIKTVRELVKINDKTALETYSEISYQQFERRANSYLVKDRTNTIVGVRIIKADGTIQEVNTEEAVLTKDQKTSREAKLAIPGLQVGDMIDYFIQVLEQAESGATVKEYLFEIADETPVLSFSVHGNVSSKYAIEYRAMNGAPDPKIATQGDDFEINLKKENIPAFPVTLWMSPMRQVPVVRMRIILGSKGRYTRKAGEIIKNVPQSEILEDMRIQATSYRYNARHGAFDGINAQVRSLLKSYNKLNTDDLPKDSLPYYLYYAFRWMSFYNTGAKTDIVVGPERNQLEVSDKSRFIYYLNEVMNMNKIDCDLVLVTSKYGTENSQVLNGEDYEVILKTREGKPMFFSADGIFTNANYIPSQYEGQKAPTMFLDKKSVAYSPRNENEAGILEIPYSNYLKNNLLEKLNVSFKSDDLQQLKIKRTTIGKGHMKISDQKQLLLFEDYYEQERQNMGVKQSLREQFEDSRRTKSLATEYDQAFSKARSDWKDQFESEIKSQFDITPKELSSFKVNKFGIRHDDPDMQFSSEFVIEGWVKKAGNNYIVDIGKLIGSQLNLEEKQRARTVDVYMPFARSFDWDVTLNIPEGYSVEGIDKLNINVDNESAGFKSIATLQGNQLTLKLSKSYKRAYETAANWPKLVTVIDASHDFNNVKVLLKKKS